MTKGPKKIGTSNLPPPRPWARASAMLCFSIVTLVGAIRMLEPETILVRACVASLMVAIVVRLARGLTLIGLPQGVRRG